MVPLIQGHGYLLIMKASQAWVLLSQAWVGTS